jgi:hypothetical protein
MRRNWNFTPIPKERTNPIVIRYKRKRKSLKSGFSYSISIVWPFFSTKSPLQGEIYGWTNLPKVLPLTTKIK